MEAGSSSVALLFVDVDRPNVNKQRRERLGVGNDKKALKM